MTAPHPERRPPFVGIRAIPGLAPANGCAGCVHTNTMRQRALDQTVALQGEVDARDELIGRLQVRLAHETPTARQFHDVKQANHALAEEGARLRDDLLHAAKDVDRLATVNASLQRTVDNLHRRLDALGHDA